MTQPNSKTLILNQRDVHDIIGHYGPNKVMDDLIEDIRKAVTGFDENEVSIPIRSGFNYQEPYLGLIEWMPLYQHGREVILKLVGYHPENPETFELPTVISTISSFDTHTGHLKSLIDGVLLTSLRTGASSAVCSSFLAHNESKTLGLIGCGAQAVTQLHALSRVFSLSQVLIYDIDSESVNNFKDRCNVLNLPISIRSANIEAIVAESDILCTATSIGSGEGPLFKKLPTKDHLHINAVGSDFPGKFEVPLDFLKQSFVCPDFLNQAVVEGECQRLCPSEIHEDWTQIASNPEKYNPLKSQRTVFDSTGWALEDAVVMRLFESYARKLGVGREVQIEAIKGDAKNPYEFLNTKATLGPYLTNKV